MPVYMREQTNLSSYGKMNQSFPVCLSDTVYLIGQLHTPTYDDSLETNKAVEYSGINSIRSPAAGAGRVSERAKPFACISACFGNQSGEGANILLLAYVRAAITRLK